MKMHWMMMGCLSLLGATACDLPDKNIGDETQGADTADTADSGRPGDECEPGEEVPADDGCNTCICDEDGFLGCTEIACDPTGPGDTCIPGTTVPAPDGCNTCECLDDGSIGACTEEGCETECTPGEQFLADDGCNICDCNDDGTFGGCTEMACVDIDPFDGPEISSCEPDTPLDPLSVVGATIDGDTLTVDVAYSGCEPGHPLGGCWNGEFLESEPVQVTIDIAHDDPLEACDAFLSDVVEINLAPMRVLYQEIYATDSGTILVGIPGLDGAVEYTF